MKEPAKHKCLNCDSGFGYEFKFCPNCGQKNTNGKITFSELWTEFQDAVFNIESRTWKTLVAIFIPGKLTLEYFAGKHRRYVHPLRLFIVASLFTIIALGFQDVQSSTNHRYVIKDRIMENYERQRLFRILDNIVDSTNNSFPEPNTKIVTDSILNVFEDSLYALLHTYGDKYGDSIDLNRYVSFTEEDSYEYVSKHDFLNLTEDELVEKYKKDDSLFDRLFFKQKAKYIQDESRLASTMLGRLSIATLLIMPLVALVLHLLYLRRRFYYIENLIFSFHVHAFSFILLTIYVLGWNIFPEWANILLIASIEVYLFIAMWKVYKQSFLKTLLKFILLNVAYIALFALFIVIIFFTSFLLL